MAEKKPHYKQIGEDLYEDADGHQFTGINSEVMEAKADGRVTEMTKAQLRKAEKDEAA